jgi:hypothetical protein
MDEDISVFMIVLDIFRLILGYMNQRAKRGKRALKCVKPGFWGV